MRLQRCQRFIDPLARQTHQVSQLLLRDAQHFAHPRVQHGVEQRRQTARHAHIGIGQPVNLARGDELAQPLVELVHDKAVKADGMVQQPVEGVDRQPRHHTFAQRLDVVAVGLALHGGALAKPPTRRHAGEGHCLSLGVVAAHLEQALHHPKPVGHRPPHAAHKIPWSGIAHQQRRLGTLAFGGRQPLQPWDIGHFGRRGWAAALVQ